jgi:H+/gluconate symporter-like permease
MKYFFFTIAGILAFGLLTVLLTAITIVSPLVLLYFLYNRYLNHKLDTLEEQEEQFESSEDDFRYKPSKALKEIHEGLKSAFK